MHESEVESRLDAAGVTNDHVKAFVKQWVAHLAPESIEVVTAADDARLLREGLDAGELQEVEGGRFFSRSYSKDTARSEERTFVATKDPADKGIYNNWVDSTEIKAKLDGLTKGAMAGKTM